MMMDEVQKQAVAIIDESLKLLKENGWCQGTSRDDQGRMCMRRAIDGATLTMWREAGFTMNTVSNNLVLRAFRSVTELEWIPHYNDCKDITYKDVVTTLKLMREEILNPQDEVILNG